MKLLPLSLKIFALCFSLTALAAENPFADIIRKTDPLPPAQEQKTFHLPPGFEIQLVASEPDIAKPMNMAFDARGRLWITQSREYPFPAAPGKGRDAIKVLENFDSHGRAQKISTFADGLNIPIGLYPYKNGVIAYSIPNISFYEDTNGNGRADKTNFLYGPFGFDKDTHGMTSAFRRGYDGWLYACHGFNNTTTLRGTDGSSITMNSGNTYRMRLDGSRVEQFTWGQVNPFGLAFDPLGNLYSADCHSSPIYQLVRGGHYPSFGKPDDGLGFVPTMMDHSHGSTAIGGIVFYADEKFPPEFRKNFFVGNVMTCRINRDSIEEHGATWRAKEEPDFLSSDDPWFRPVDLQLAPDGSIYVADFYNRIIGHYEVPLNNPGRDRERGRIWRIVYVGQASSLPARRSHSKAEELSQLSLPKLISELGDANLTRRLFAMNEITDRIGPPAIAPLQKILRSSKDPFQKIHALWILQRLGGLDEKMISRVTKDTSPSVRVHALRTLGESSEWNSARQKLLVAALGDDQPWVRRVATESLGLHPDAENIRPLLNAKNSIAADDTYSLYVWRMALRNQFQAPENFRRLPELHLTEAESRAISDVAVAVTNTAAAEFLLGQIQKFPDDRDQLSVKLRHIARYGASGSAQLAAFTEKNFADDLDLQLALFQSVQQGAAQRGGAPDPSLADWGARLAEKLFASVAGQTSDWRNFPVSGIESESPWILQKRDSADGYKNLPFICSLPPGGEKLTGLLRSPPFTIPAQLRFFMAGHDGFPDQPAGKKNYFQLREAGTKKILALSFPPRHDRARAFRWDLAAFAGRKGFLEIVDGDDGTAYAWLAVGRFDPEIVPLPKNLPTQIEQRRQAAAEMAASLRLTNLEPQLDQIFSDREASPDTRSAAAKALGALNFPPHLADFGDLLNDAAAPEKLRGNIATVLGDADSEVARKILLTALSNSPRKLQMQIAPVLAANAEGAETLLSAAEDGKISARLLQENSTRDRITALKNPEFIARLEKLVSRLTPLSVEKQRVIDERRAKFSRAAANTEMGAKIFTQTCAVCHQLDQQGALIGPQLDGVGSRGAERLIEDILDPNRNVDRAFRTTLIVLRDGDVQSGLFRREEGETMVLANSTGKEISIPKKEIKERRESESSLMPDNFSDVITPQDFNHLLAFLLAHGTKVSAR